jgi:hypothetical protein
VGRVELDDRDRAILAKTKLAHMWLVPVGVVWTVWLAGSIPVKWGSISPIIYGLIVKLVFLIGGWISAFFRYRGDAVAVAKDVARVTVLFFIATTTAFVIQLIL